jgi:hypothetical protein
MCTESYGYDGKVTVRYLITFGNIPRIWRNGFRLQFLRVSRTAEIRAGSFFAYADAKTISFHASDAGAAVSIGWDYKLSAKGTEQWRVTL